jgi:acyl-coenzyme A thioesterase PaaI-like protein
MSSTQQGFYSRIAASPNTLRILMNLWLPLIGMRIHITHVGADWRSARVRMKLSLRNKNYVGTHFGGALFAMTDPFYMLLLMNALGKEFTVWDKAASIDFLKPGRGTVWAHFEITDAMLTDIHAKTQGGEKYEPTYDVNVVNDAGEVIARVRKTLWIRARAPK